MNRRVEPAAEAGERLSEPEAVERLLAEGSPPLAPGQRRLVELLDIFMKMDGDRAERLFNTARELAGETDAAWNSCRQRH